MADFKAAILIDGGFLRVTAKKANKTYDPDFIEKFAHLCKSADESIFRILYYDCAMYSGTSSCRSLGLLTLSRQMTPGSMHFRTKTCLRSEEEC